MKYIFLFIQSTTIIIILMINLNLSAISVKLTAQDYLKQVALSSTILKDKTKLGFLPSYTVYNQNTSFDFTHKNFAYIYDNSLAAIAFISLKEKKLAQQIVDTIIVAQNNDRYYSDGRIRNVYLSNHSKIINPFPIAGYFNTAKSTWIEDKYQVGTDIGNVAWTIVALLTYYQNYGGNNYLIAAERLGEWVEHNCRDPRGAGGYSAGFIGWEPNPSKLLYKSTEHNIDLYAAFTKLAINSHNSIWHNRALIAKKFVLSMWDEQEGKYWSGTLDDGISLNKTIIPLDAQTLSTLSFTDMPKISARAIDYSEKHHRLNGGFDFTQHRDGIWYEGTSQMSLAYHQLKQEKKSNDLLKIITIGQNINGGIMATNVNSLSTTFGWDYYPRPHIGATAWFILAKNKFNPLSN